MNSRKPIFVRASIRFPPDRCETLEEIAKQKKMSPALAVRDAAEKYVALEKRPPRRRGEK